MLKQHIKDWVLCDQEIASLERQIKSKKQAKRELSSNLMEIMSQHKIDCFDMQNGSKIVYSRREMKKPISGKKMHELLAKYFQGNEDQVHDLQNYIMENRDVVVRESILRK